MAKVTGFGYDRYETPLTKALEDKGYFESDAQTSPTIYFINTSEKPVKLEITRHSPHVLNPLDMDENNKSIKMVDEASRTAKFCLNNVEGGIEIEIDVLEPEPLR